MAMIDHTKVKKTIRSLCLTVKQLEEMFPGRYFTPDGHMVSSIGECVVADAYDLELMIAGNRGFDAVSKSGVKIEIETTQ